MTKYLNIILVKMKFLILLSLVTIFDDHILCADVNVPNDRLTPKAVIQQFNELMRDADNPEDVELPFPIPILDVYEFEDAELHLPGDIFSINLNISKGSISGFSGYRLLELNISNTKPVLRFNVLFPSLTFHSEHYELDGNIYYAVPLQGHGVAHIDVLNLQLWGTLHMKQSATSNAILFDKLENAGFSVERIVSRTEFDHNIDDIISALVEDLLADYLNRFNKYITATYSDIVIQYINDIVQQFENN